MAAANGEASATENNCEQLNVSPLAFTIQFENTSSDGKKLKIHDKLSSFALKHRRNPSLPEIKSKAVKSFDETLPSQAVQKFGKHLAGPKAGYHSEGYFSSDQDDESIKIRGVSRMQRTMISPVTEDKGIVPEVNGTKCSEPPKNGGLRRSSMNDLDLKQMLKPNMNSTFTMEDHDCDKSDTVSEAGTYTIDKDESPKVEKKKSALDGNVVLEEGEPGSRKMLSRENHKWINDWVKRVAEETSIITPKSGQLSSGSSSASASKIPSPVNTMPKVRDPLVSRRNERTIPTRPNGVHRRSSSLSARDFNENRKSDSSMETESYLNATESVMVAMQTRMRQNLTLNLANEKRNERLHPPSTASDTDTNSDNDGKVFKKPLGAHFSSARLNRAFSLRRARADIEVETCDRKRNSPSPAAVIEKRHLTAIRSTNSPSTATVAKSKPQPSSPFARTDVGRFSMRSNASAPKTINSPSQKPKESRKPQAGGRSNSSLSSREMEFQNWKRRKSFDPMKAAAEGRKKEAAKKASCVPSPSAHNLAMTQSVNLGTTVEPRSGPVLRSASFHTSTQLTEQVTPPDLDDEDDDDDDDDEEDLSVEERGVGSPISSHLSASHHPVLPPNSPNKMAVQRGGAGSRNSLASEVHSSPSRRARAEFIDNLLVSAISELSIDLKLKSCDLLKKLETYCEGEDRILRMREELSLGESQRGSANSSPAHRPANRDFPAILKNLKSLENVLQLVDDVLFGGAEAED